MFVPREYQKNIINHIIEHKRCCVFAGMGMGKTASTLFAVSALKAIGEVKKVLVLAPLRVASSTWPDEVQKRSARRRLSVIVIFIQSITRGYRGLQSGCSISGRSI